MAMRRDWARPGRGCHGRGRALWEQSTVVCGEVHSLASVVSRVSLAAPAACRGVTSVTWVVAFRGRWIVAHALISCVTRSVESVSYYIRYLRDYLTSHTLLFSENAFSLASAVATPPQSDTARRAIGAAACAALMHTGRAVDESSAHRMQFLDLGFPYSVGECSCVPGM